MLVLSSEKLVLEQHSFTFAEFCRPRPTPGAAGGARAEFREASFVGKNTPPHQLSSEKLVLEQHSFTFADFCCPRPPLGPLPVPVLSSEKRVLEQHSFTFADFRCPRRVRWSPSRSQKGPDSSQNNS